MVDVESYLFTDLYLYEMITFIEVLVTTSSAGFPRNSW